ncbi:hypothetical protein BDR03DRAFT_987549 [Suillus americanus]|nr:hypothetical protein BDR03DRAFT_987962 [Suillus americanus]KAG2029770.1 hypothetical protein BDR03DRAFT_987549 [Suillus americanus]
MTTTNKLELRTAPCDTCAEDGTECFGVMDTRACDPCKKRCSFLQGPQPRLRPYVMRACMPRNPGCTSCQLMKRPCKSWAGQACVACEALCSHVPKADNAEDDAYSESDESESSDSSDDLVLLDEKPSDWEEPARKRRKLSVVAGASPEDEVTDLQERLAKMEELRLRVEQECQKIRSRLAHLNGVS